MHLYTTWGVSRGLPIIPCEVRRRFVVYCHSLVSKQAEHMPSSTNPSSQTVSISLHYFTCRGFWFLHSLTLGREHSPRHCTTYTRFPGDNWDYWQMHKITWCNTGNLMNTVEAPILSQTFSHFHSWHSCCSICMGNWIFQKWWLLSWALNLLCHSWLWSDWDWSVF